MTEKDRDDMKDSINPKDQITNTLVAVYKEYKLLMVGSTKWDLKIRDEVECLRRRIDIGLEAKMNI